MKLCMDISFDQNRKQIRRTNTKISKVFSNPTMPQISKNKKTFPFRLGLHINLLVQ